METVITSETSVNFYKTAGATSQKTIIFNVSVVQIDIIEDMFEIN
jgi:hypothetical protein